MLKQYLAICWLGSTPSELPTSRPFLWNSIIFYLIAGYFIQANLNDPVEAFIQVLLELFITLVFIAVLVMIKRSMATFEQVITAFICSENFLYFMAMPIAIWYIFVKNTDQGAYPLYVGIFVMLWFCAMVSHLLKGLFAFGSFTSILLSFIYFGVTYLGSFLLLL